MALHLDVVVDEPADFDDRRRQSVSLIGEILPFVLAKYELKLAGVVWPRRTSRSKFRSLSGGEDAMSFDY